MSMSMRRLLSSLVPLCIILLAVPKEVTALSSTSSSVPKSSHVQSISLSHNQQGLADAGKFPRTWVPLASIYELDPDRPTALEFLGQRYVAYRSNTADSSNSSAGTPVPVPVLLNEVTKNWVVMDDACPHRLAPLSEGRVDRATNTLECSYHGWAFDSNGDCQRIPQAEASVAAAALKSAKCAVQSYPVQIVKNILWVWPWADDCLSVLSQAQAQAHPAAMVAGVLEESTTYTRDLAYGWDTLLENLVDPAHVPWAHHGLQGTRQDAVPINMTTPVSMKNPEHGFEFGFADVTGGKRRSGTGVFRAPFTLQYNAVFDLTEQQKVNGDKPSFFNLTALCIPTKPGWSRTIVFGAPPASKENKDIIDRKVEATVSSGVAVQTKKKKAGTPLFVKIIRMLPVWMLHQLSNRFLDSDLAFLHYQEQERNKRGVDLDGYFMPAQVRSVVMLLVVV